MYLFSHQNLKRGIFFALLAWLSFSTMYMLSKLISKETTTATILFFRNCAPLVLLSIVALKKPRSQLILKKPFTVIFRSLLGLINLTLIIFAIEKISLVNASLLNNTAPFFIPFFAWFWLKSPINHKVWPAILVGFLGIAAVLQPDARLFNVGSIYALLSGICFAVMMITMRKSAVEERLFPYLFYFFLVGFVASLPFAWIYFKVGSLVILLALIAIGLCSLSGQLLLFYALKEAKVNYIGPISYSTVIFSGIYELLIWHKLPTPLTYLGVCLIILAGGWILWLNKDAGYPKKP